ncbi:MAG: ATP-binding protein [Verrucomicrobiota bacterium]
MSNTRHAKPGNPLRQERYASSEEFQRGLNGYLVSRRGALLDKPEDRELIYWLQWLSHRDGGLQKFAEQIVAENQTEIGTPSMLAFGKRAGQRYNAEQVRTIRREIKADVQFLLKGETYGDLNPEYLLREIWQSDSQWEKQKRESQNHPTSYSAEEFLAVCRREFTAAAVEKFLTQLCLDPETSPDNGPWYCDRLIEIARRCYQRGIEESKARTVVTSLGEKLNDALDYALESRRMVLIEGLARMGKTFSARAWAEQHPGRARYVQVPSTNDEGGFFRAIAKALGLSCGPGWKAVQLRERVEETLQSGNLLLILDEAHYLWPVSNSRFAFPSRVTWIMTALVNHGVPVALISTPQFIKTQKVLEQRTHWTAEQFTGRIGHYEKLPDSLSENDLAKVARSLLPEGDAKAIKLLTLYAQGSSKYLAGIEAIVCRARYLALKEKRGQVSFTDLKVATEESVIPSDSALSQALALPVQRRKKTFLQPVNGRLTTDENPAAESLGGRIHTTNFADQKPAEMQAGNRLESRRDPSVLAPA